MNATEGPFPHCFSLQQLRGSFTICRALPETGSSQQCLAGVERLLKPDG